MASLPNFSASEQKKSNSSSLATGSPLYLFVWGLEFRIQGSGFRVQGSGFRVQGSGCRGQPVEPARFLSGLETPKIDMLLLGF